MKKIISHSSIADRSKWHQYSFITSFFIPEFITALVLYSIPLLIDARFIAYLQSTHAYATLGLTNTLLHFILKVAEGASVGILVITGQENTKEEKDIFTIFIHSILYSAILGMFFAGFLFIGADCIYSWYKVPLEIKELGIPFLKIRALSVFFAFIYFTCVGFLRGLKNSHVPMIAVIVGALVFVGSDYLLIFGTYSWQGLGLYGSALASVIQYITMSIVLLTFIAYLFIKNKNTYSKSFQLSLLKRISALSLPVMIDKGVFAAAAVWLGKCIAPMGVIAIASFSVIKDLERFAFLPAIAFAQVTTLIISNLSLPKDYDYYILTTKRILFLSLIMVMGTLAFCSVFPHKIIHLFDIKGDFTEFAATVFPIISVFVVFDILQIILAAALRAQGKVKSVMIIRLAICFLFFGPITYFLSINICEHYTLKFLLIYTSFYISNALMGLLYLKDFYKK
jgi:putative MATE family efflux protein